LEPTGLIGKDGKRPDGTTLTPWSKDKCLIWDATCVDTLAHSYINQISNTPGAAAELMTNKKKNLYSDIVVGHHFLAFAVETLGSFSADTKAFIDKIGKRLNKNSGNPNAKAYFVQKVSIEIQRGMWLQFLALFQLLRKLMRFFI
jgi:hypothetical protein